MYINRVNYFISGPKKGKQTSKKKNKNKNKTKQKQKNIKTHHLRPMNFLNSSWMSQRLGLPIDDICKTFMVLVIFET